MIHKSCDVFKYNNVDAKLSIKSLELEDGALMYCCTTYVETENMVQGNKIKRIVNTTKLISMSRYRNSDVQMSTQICRPHTRHCPKSSLSSSYPCLDFGVERFVLFSTVLLSLGSCSASNKALARSMASACSFSTKKRSSS